MSDSILPDIVPAGTMVQARRYGWDGSLITAETPVFPSNWGGVPDDADTVDTGLVEGELALDVDR